MNNPCFRHVDCPTGTGSASDGFNYSSEYIEVKSYPAISYPDSPYGYYTSCQGRCLSLVSQQDADLCAQRLAKICQNDGGLTAGGGGGGSGSSEPTLPTYGNDQQICTITGTGRTVVVPADVFIANSKAEANAQALSYANNQQQQPTTPPGVTIAPGPDTPKLPVNPPNVIPHTPPPQPPPPPPPTSQCKPCDDTSAVFAFTLVIDVPADEDTVTVYSPLLKCGKWRFTLTTDDPGGIGGEAGIVGYLVAGDPAHTEVPPGSLELCDQLTWVMPCSPDPCPDDPFPPATVDQMALEPGCCNTISTECGYIDCQTLDDGSHWMTRLAVQYATADPITSARKFTMTGTWLGPKPPTP